MAEQSVQQAPTPIPENTELSFSPLEIATHIVWWAVYVLSGLFVVHAAIVYVVQSRVSGRTSVLAVMVGVAKWVGRSVVWLRKFADEPARIKLFLQAGWPISPYLLPWMTAPAVIKADPTVERDTSDRIPEETRKAVFSRDDGECVVCGRSADTTEIHIDHVTPVSQDGSHNNSNLRLLCRDCHQARHARLFDPGALESQF